MIIQAYAKINLGLNVLEKNDDGYHKIDMVTIPLKMHDSLEIFEIPNNSQTYITSDDPNLVCDESNLVFKALKMFTEVNDMKRSYRIHIYKRIPTEAGLGGGSADAAAVIRALCKLLKIDIESPEIVSLAKKVGSDVPLCLYNKPFHVTGTGEVLNDLDLKKSYYVIIVKPQKGLSTKTVYEKLDEMRESNPLQGYQTSLNPLIESLESKDKNLISEYIINSLTEPAISLVPEIHQVLLDLKENKLDLIGMSGSGTACFGLHSNKKVIDEIARKLSKKDYDIYVTEFLGHKDIIKKNKEKR